jgi:pimeloyl-ACP methyl ester carboxylesterase
LALETAKIGDLDIEYFRIPALNPDFPTLVFLHEGLGCAALWKNFPQKLCERTGCGGLVYSRAGYGGSSSVSLPRPINYMQIEAIEFLPKVLDHFDIKNVALVGHSDGASIALVHAGLMENESRIKAVIVEAPHVFCEKLSVKGIEEAKLAYETGGLRERLGKYHGNNIDVAFRGWNDAWLNADFWHWNIEQYLPGITAPMLAIQGIDDVYGTMAQLASIQSKTTGSYEELNLDNCGHSPHVEQTDAVLDAMSEFITRKFRRGDD